MVRFSLGSSPDADGADDDVSRYEDAYDWQQGTTPNSLFRSSTSSRAVVPFPRHIRPKPNRESSIMSDITDYHDDDDRNSIARSEYSQQNLSVVHERPRPPPMSKSKSFLLSALLAIVAAYCVRQNPDQRNFVENTCYKTFLLLTDAYYRGVDVVELSNHRYRRYKRGRCILSVPSSSSSSSRKSSNGEAEERTLSPTTVEWLRGGIVGQDRAITSVASSLEGWAPVVGDADDDEIPPIESDRPMALLLAGPRGVGKSEMAYLTSELLLRRCYEDGEGDGGRHSGRDDWLRRREEILILQGDDFAQTSRDYRNNHDVLDFDNLPPSLDEVRNEQLLNRVKYGSAVGITNREKLVRKIVTHVRRHEGDGAVVILNDIELIDASVLNVIAGAFDNAAAPAGSGAGRRRSSVLSYYDERRRRTIDADCGGVLFVFTTTLGTERVLRLVRKYGGTDRVPSPEMEASLREAMDHHWNGRLNLGKLANDVVPLLPLGPLELEQILRRKCDALSAERAFEFWRRLEVTPAATRHLIGTGYVDYLDLRTQDSTSSLLVFSQYGAVPLDHGKPMKLLQSAISLHLRPYRPRLVAVIDYERERHEVVIRWCSEVDGGEESGETPLANCEHVWRGLFKNE